MKLSSLPAVALLAVSACHVGSSSRHLPIGTVHRSLPGTDIEKIRVENNVGFIRFVTWDEADLHVGADVRVRDTRVEEFPSADGDRDLTVEIVDGWARVRNAHLDEDDQNDWSMDLTVHVPTSCRIAHLQTGVGDVEFTGSVGELTLGTGVGDLEVHGTAEELRATTGVGSMRVDGNLTRATCETGTGDVVVMSERLETGHFESGVGDVRVHAGTGPDGRLEASTGTGDIDLQVSAAFDGRVDLSTGVGGVRLSGCDELMVRRDVTSASADGTLGDGEALVHGRTGVGSLTLRLE